MPDWTAKLDLDPSKYTRAMDSVEARSAQAAQTVDKGFAKASASLAAVASVAVLGRISLDALAAGMDRMALAREHNAAAMRGDLAGAMEAELKMGRRTEQLIASIPLLGGAVSRLMQAFGDTAQIEKAISRVRALETAAANAEAVVRRAQSANVAGDVAAFGSPTEKLQAEADVARRVAGRELTTMISEAKQAAIDQRQYQAAADALRKSDPFLPSLATRRAIARNEDMAADAVSKREQLESDVAKRREALDEEMARFQRRIEKMTFEETRDRNAEADALNKERRGNLEKLMKDQADKERQIANDMNRDVQRGIEERYRTEISAAMNAYERRQKMAEDFNKRIEGIETDRIRNQESYADRRFSRVTAGLSPEAAAKQARVMAGQSYGQAGAAYQSGALGESRRLLERTQSYLERGGGSLQEADRVQAMIQQLYQKEQAQQRTLAAANEDKIKLLEERLAELSSPITIKLDIEQAQAQLDTLFRQAFAGGGPMPTPGSMKAIVGGAAGAISIQTLNVNPVQKLDRAEVRDMIAELARSASRGRQ